MNILIQPTPELTEITINGVAVPVRIWTGVTAGGVDVEVVVYCVTPDNESDVERFKEELPDYMVRAASLADIGPYKKDPDAT